MKEQIEEMCEVLRQNAESCKTCSWYEEGLCIGNCELAEDNQTVCETLYNAGYRKQKHGTWYHGTENGAVYAKCSACGRKMDYSCYGYAYCSLCGARMDGAKMKGADNG